VDQDWIGLMIFKHFADQDWIGFNFIGSDWTRTEKFHCPLISGVWYGLHSSRNCFYIDVSDSLLWITSTSTCSIGFIFSCKVIVRDI